MWRGLRGEGRLANTINYSNSPLVSQAPVLVRELNLSLQLLFYNTMIGYLLFYIRTSSKHLTQLVNTWAPNIVSSKLKRVKIGQVHNRKQQRQALWRQQAIASI